jgi:hypothetical protein
MPVLRLKRPRGTCDWSPPRAAVSVPAYGGGELPQRTRLASVDQAPVTGGDQLRQEGLGAVDHAHRLTANSRS